MNMVLVAGIGVTAGLFVFELLRRKRELNEFDGTLKRIGDELSNMTDELIDLRSETERFKNLSRLSSRPTRPNLSLHSIAVSAAQLPRTPAKIASRHRSGMIRFPERSQSLTHEAREGIEERSMSRVSFPNESYSMTSLSGITAPPSSVHAIENGADVKKEKSTRLRSIYEGLHYHHTEEDNGNC